ncbi:MAG: cyclic nucleotide-binding domain-containing protein [Bacteroidota bacterium]|nr:cyclic nucleotide-binding domain-containing protein [Bacteroidota bacterium]
MGSNSNLETINILKATAIFNDVSDDILQKISDSLEEIAIAKEEIIFKKGDIGNAMYIISEGSVRVHDKGHVITRLNKREVFGEYSLFDLEKRSASITAEENSVLLKLDQDVFYLLLAQNTEIMQGIIKVLTGRIRHMNELESKLSSSYLKIRKQNDEIEAQNKKIQLKNRESEKNNKKLYALNEEKSHLINIIAHDLKNPLASSICVTDILKSDKDNLNKEQQETVDVLFSSMKNMNDIIDQILDIQQLETKNIGMKIEKVNLSLIIKEALHNFEYAINAKELNINFNQRNIFALINKKHSKIAFENLFHNFIKYSSNNSNLIIDMDENNDKAIITIEDTGEGKKNEDVKKLFGIYQKPQIRDSITWPTAKDSIIIKYFEAMQAKLEFISTPNKGFKTTVMFNK